jgi:cytochrome c-type biogenesis protein CcmF
MPWLCVTMFLHASVVTARDGRWRRVTVGAATFPFALGVLGVYLTRSGVTGSIHSFAEDPVVGTVLLSSALIVTAVVVSTALRAGRGAPWEAIGTGRDTWLAASSVLVAMTLAFVLVGTAYPAYLEVFFDRDLTVDSAFFVSTVAPVAIPLACLVGFALRTGWRRAGITRVDLAVFAVGAMTATLLVVGLAEAPVAVATVLVAAATGAFALGVREVARGRGRAMLGARLAHLGLAMVLIGAAGSAMGSEFAGTVAIGDVVEVGRHSIELVAIDTGEADRYVWAQGEFVVDGGSRLRPQIRAYEDQPTPVAEPALRSTPVSDLIIAVSRLSPDLGSFEVSVFVRPMVWWVWAGALVMAAGGGFALYVRSGASGGRRRSARGGLQPAGTTTGATGR